MSLNALCWFAATAMKSRHLLVHASVTVGAPMLAHGETDNSDMTFAVAPVSPLMCGLFVSEMI